jgi:hypothetical protein
MIHCDIETCSIYVQLSIKYIVYLLVILCKNINLYRVIKNLCVPDDCNTESLSCLTSWLYLTSWQPTARARGTLDKTLTPSFLISSFRRVLNVACNILGFPRRVVFNSRRFGTRYLLNFYRRVDIHSPMKMEQTQCSETSAIKHTTPGNNPKDYMQR